MNVLFQGDLPELEESLLDFFAGKRFIAGGLVLPRDRIRPCNFVIPELTVDYGKQEQLILGIQSFFLSSIKKSKLCGIATDDGPTGRCFESLSDGRQPKDFSKQVPEQNGTKTRPLWAVQAM